jgi:glycosyltransferase involved in cell wall biosynthesis
VAITRGREAPADVFVVRNGPDLEIFRPVDPDPSHSSGAGHLIGYVGAMNSQDGVGLALAALAALARCRSDWHAVFVGDGEVLADAQESVVRLGIDDQVTFTGFVRDKRRLVEIISSCDVCISPEPRNPLNEQSTFLKVMEYMAVVVRSSPSISSRLAGLPEMQRSMPFAMTSTPSPRPSTVSSTIPHVGR